MTSSAFAMSLSISVIAPSGELSWLTGRLAGSSAEAITSIEVGFAERSTARPCAPRNLASIA